MKTVMVTGAAGFTGAALCRKLAGRVRILALCRRAAPQLEEIGAQVVRGDLSDPMPETVGKVDAVVHLAQSDAFRDFPENAETVFEVNCRATQRLLDFAHRRGCRNFVLASTGGVYGAGPNPFREDDPIQPGSGPLAHYFATKLAAEALARSYGGLMTVTILRPFFIYGADQPADRLMLRLAHRVMNGEPVRLEGEDGLHINPIHVADTVEAVSRAIDSEQGGCFNLAGPEVVSLRSIAVQLGRILGKEPVFDRVPDSDASTMVADISRLSSELYAPQIGIEEGLRDLVRNLSV